MAAHGREDGRWRPTELPIATGEAVGLHLPGLASSDNAEAAAGAAMKLTVTFTRSPLQ
jgi:hypothetical protein